MTHEFREVWPIEYAAEHAEIYREKEQLRISFRFESPQMVHRSYLVCWMCKKAEQFKFCTCTVHLSIYILDIFMDNFNIDLERLHLVALVCLQLASKYEEHDVKIPKISHFNSTMKNRYSIKDFHDLEIMMLSFLDWNLSLPTAAHFAEYFSLYAVTKRDWNPREYLSYETFWQEAQRAVKDYLDLSLLNLDMMNFLPSLVACACILLARQQLHVSCKWTTELQEVTKYHGNELTICANTILSKSPNHKMDRKRKFLDSPDVGYVTGDSTKSTPEGNSTKRHKESGNKRCKVSGNKLYGS